MIRWVVVALIVAAAAPARAIPPFARRYGWSCTRCHQGGPTKLNSFGEAFRDNGYRVPVDDARWLRDRGLPLGQPIDEKLFPRAMWPSEIPAVVPIGVAGEARAGARWPKVGAAEGDLGATAKLLVGGGVARNISFFAVMEGGTDGIALDQLFGVARSVLDRWLGESALNFKIGRMELDLFALQPGLNRTREAPLAQLIAVGKDGFTLAEPKEAIEVYGLLGGRVKWVAGVANGQKPLDDLSTRRDFFGRVMVKLGGLRLDYRHALPTTPETTAFFVGGWAYYGRGVAEVDGARWKSDLTRAGLDLRLRGGGFDLVGEVLYGNDSNPDGDRLGAQQLAWDAGVDWSYWPWLQPYARFEEVRFDRARDDRRRVVLGAAVFVRANVRFRVEGMIGLTDQDAHGVVVDAFWAL